MDRAFSTRTPRPPHDRLGGLGSLNIFRIFFGAPLQFSFLGFATNFERGRVVHNTI